MSNTSMEGLPPEMQARIASIIEQAKAKPFAPNTPHEAAMAPQPEPEKKPAPIQRPPSLMDHTIMLRHEVVALKQQLEQMAQQLNAVAQVVDATGGAVGQLYGMFHEQSTPTTYSQGFSEAPPSQVDDY